jgi:hypothetical protein
MRYNMLVYRSLYVYRGRRLNSPWFFLTYSFQQPPLQVECWVGRSNGLHGSPVASNTRPKPPYPIATQS